jgi:hypothetical protein
MSSTQKDVIGTSSKIAQELEQICTESECDMDTVLAELIAYMGGPELAATKIYHRHHAPNDELRRPDLVLEGGPAFYADVAEESK